ncbi:hypothetical protein GH722_01335 [Alphaproteobacteria bacterium HT1-32]|nr:hypothetical protein [Alphaproteobacteria bacterium HT1-32]
MERSKIVNSLLPTTLFIFLLCAFVFADQADARSRADKDRVIVGATPTAILIWLAKDLGYFDGLPIEIVRMQSGITTGRAVLDGTVDIATSSDFAFTALALERDELRLLATLSSTQTARLIARLPEPASGAEKLRQLRYAVTKNGIGHYFLWQYLALHGLELADVDLTFLPPDEIVDAMRADTINAALTWEPYVARIENAIEPFAVYFRDQLDQFYYFCLYSTKSWIDQNEALAGKFLLAIKRAEKFAQTYPEDSIDRLSRALLIDRSIMTEIWRSHTLRALLPQDIPSILELATEWRMKEKLTNRTAIPNVLNFIDTRPLRAISPDSVHMLK